MCGGQGGGGGGRIRCIPGKNLLVMAGTRGKDEKGASGSGGS